MISSDRANAALLATMNYRLGFHLHGVARTVTRTGNSPCGSSSLITSLSKSLQAAERRRADLPRARRRWIATQGLLEGAHLNLYRRDADGIEAARATLGYLPRTSVQQINDSLAQRCRQNGPRAAWSSCFIPRHRPHQGANHRAFIVSL
jgi:hypothetical protein